MSKNSNKQRYDQLKEWDRWMQNEYPNYKERKKKVKLIGKSMIIIYSA